jgi:tRNA threonylcarbamoyladenosine biosynthesis protein TsaB
MIFLALETATSRQSLAIFRDENLLGYLECEGSRSLTPQIIPAIHQLLGEVSLQIADLEGLVVSLGPGTFTGLRVGLATMTAFRFALGIPLVGVSTLAGLAWNLPNSDVPIVSTVSIRAELVYWGHFRWQQGHLICHAIDQIGKFPEICASLTEPTMVLGDGWIRNKECLQTHSRFLIEGPSEGLWPSAKGIGRAGCALLETGPWLTEGCTPQYIQPSYAERSQSSAPA